MNNYADFAATNLRYYGLSPDSAEYDGQGTVWTHKTVSNYLGGADHTDDYLARNNYSYDELYDLINEKYLIQTGQVADWEKVVQAIQAIQVRTMIILTIQKHLLLMRINSK